MARPVDRIKPMLELLEQAWLKNPDQRLGQIVGNAARGEPTVNMPFGVYRDPFNVEDDEMWDGLKRIGDAGYSTEG